MYAIIRQLRYSIPTASVILGLQFAARKDPGVPKLRKCNFGPFASFYFPRLVPIADRHCLKPGITMAYFDSAHSFMSRHLRSLTYKTLQHQNIECLRKPEFLNTMEIPGEQSRQPNAAQN